MTKINFSTSNFSSKNKYLVFTLLPTTINISVVSSEKNKLPEVFFTITEILIYKKNINNKDFILEYLKSLDKACSRVSYKLDNDLNNTFFLDSAFIFVSEPWIDSHIIDLVDEKVIPFKINKEYLEKIEKKDFFENDFKDYISAKANEYDIDFLNFRIREDDKIQKLELNIIEQKIKRGFENSVKHIINKNFLLSGIFFESYFMPIINISLEIFREKKDKIIINVYKEFTIMRFFYDSRLDSITKIPLGTNKIIKEIKEYKNIDDNNEAVKIFDKIRNNEVGDDSGLKEIILNHKKEYISYINKSLSNYKKYQISPNILLISSDKRSLLVEDKDIFGSNVYKINQEFMNNFVQFSNIKYFDIHIALATHYLFQKNN